jgi:hypothetical protein
MAFSAMAASLPSAEPLVFPLLSLRAARHARSGVTAEAGVWAEALAVDTKGASMIVATEEQPTTAGGWAAA